VTGIPTMVDVAREARVGLKTVSRFVNGETNIDPVLVERIRLAIAGLGYRRNLAAASIRPGWTPKVLGLLISDLANPYYSTLARAIEEYAGERNYLLTTTSSDEDGGRHDRFIDRLMEQRVDGLIVVPPRHPARSWLDVVPPIPPVVFIDRPGDYPAADVVLADNAGGAEQATHALAAAGARRIAFVGDSLEIYTMRERHDGYARALAAAGLVGDPGLVESGAHSVEQATRAVARLLRSGAADAIFAANNRSSIGAILAFREAGRRLPLIGFDDFEAAFLTTPAVSVVSQDIALMGRTAAEIVLGRLAGDEFPRVERTLFTRLVLRGSELP
jgi:LacI family transcriptional regulator